MIPISTGGNVVMLVDERVRVADLVKSGQRLRWLKSPARRTESDKPLSVAERENARREALNIAGRHLLEVGGTDRQIIDGQLVELTARVVTAKPEVNHDDSRMGEA